MSNRVNLGPKSPEQRAAWKAGYLAKCKNHSRDSCELSNTRIGEEIFTLRSWWLYGYDNAAALIRSEPRYIKLRENNA